MSMKRARVKGVFKPSDYPGSPDEATKKDLDALFEHLFPGAPEPKPEPHFGFAILAQNPRLAMNVASLLYYIVREMPWTQQRDLRELAVQTLNLHFKCDFSFQAHLIYAQAHGVSLEKQAAIPYWRTTNLFSDEERLVIEYTSAVVSGDVRDALFSRVVGKYGEKGAIEFTTAIAWWSLWAMILNATRPEFSLEHASPLPADMRELGRFGPTPG
jgi:alkylhydroperoxidase family enzyme